MSRIRSTDGDHTATGVIDTLLSAYPAGVQELAREARKTLQTWLPGADEAADFSARLLAFSYGPGYRGAVCTLILSQSGVKLGLVNGAALDDPNELLAGSGKVHRHVQLRTPEDLQRTGLRQLVGGARAMCLKRLEDRARKP